MIDKINTIIGTYKDSGYSLTLRQMYYVLVSQDLIENNLKSYKAIGDLVSDARMAGRMDWDAIDDRLREIRTVSTWRHPSDLLEACARQFKLDLWMHQVNRVEVWVEKDSLAEIVTRAAHALRCPVMVCRGYMSQSAMWEAGYRRFKDYHARGLHPIVIHLGDHDPSGMDMSRDIQDRLDMFSECRVQVDRIALNMDQIEQYEPPPNPAKVTDSRAKEYIRKFGTESWELDALDPKELDILIQDRIQTYRDSVAWNDMLRKEERCCARLQEIADNYEE
jgi:hypothetical protein